MKKLFVIFVCVVMLMIIGISFNGTNNNILDDVRVLNADGVKIQNITEFNAEYINSFEYYEYSDNGNSIGFTGSDEVKASLLNGYELLDTDDETLNKMYDVNYNIENNVYEVSINISNSKGKIIDSYQGDFEPIFATNEDGKVEIYFELENKLIPLSLVYSQGPIENLSDIVLDDLQGGGGAAIILFAIIIVPYVVQVATEVIEGIGTVVTTIYDWFTTTIFGSGTSAVIESSYTLDINDVKYDFVVLTQTEINSMNKNNIYIAIADSDTGLMWISIVSVTESMAASILAAQSEIISLAGSKTLVVSTYTYYPSKAYTIAAAAGGGAAPVYHPPHGGGDSGYYEHYHPVINGLVGASHSFFGNPTI